ncbi:MAG: hypothetical protein HQK55_01950 [Deltaproteobacteria bacterium]|nr:hypothetical protein [Deltaproteobacteria bacterium]
MTLTSCLPPLATITVGSVPFLNVDEALDLVTKASPRIPAWPQMPGLGYREGMVLQAMDGLPLLAVDQTGTGVQVLGNDRVQALTEFYEHFLTGDLDYFAVPNEASHSLKAFLDRAYPAFPGESEFLKAQTVGPITFGQSVRTLDGKNLIDDPELADTLVKGLGAKAAWLARQISMTGRTPIIFLDEPGLAEFGSAFSTLQADQVLAMLNETADIARSFGPANIGIHICGNTDWGLIAELNLEIINFDAFGYLDQFRLYPRQVKSFLERGGWIAWGIVPTREFVGLETPEELAEKLLTGWRELAASGIDLDLLRNQALISPSCGLSTIGEKNAKAVLKILPEVAALVREKTN